MANAVYPEYKEFLLSASANVSLNVDDATDGPFVALIDTNDVAYSSAHNFYDDVVAAEVGTPQRITTPTVANGTFDGDNVTYTAVTGDVVEALVVYRHNAGANSTWKLVVYLDTGITGLPVTPNGGDITVTWHGTGIFTI
jgi:activator of HSP90 ATPase